MLERILRSARGVASWTKSGMEHWTVYEGRKENEEFVIAGLSVWLEDRWYEAHVLTYKREGAEHLFNYYHFKSAEGRITVSRGDKGVRELYLRAERAQMHLIT